jgi:NDP-hexose-3-ketoreductase
MRIGILNCSDIARRRMIPAMQSVPGVEVTIVCSRSKEKAKEYAKEFGIPQYTDNPEDLYIGLDAVYISSPPSEHYEPMTNFICRGIDVLCEKSLTISTGQTESVIRDAEQFGVIVQENYGFQFHPQWKYIMKSLEDIGDIISINSGFEFPPRDTSSDFRYNKNLGGGALLDAGGYPIKAASLIMSKINLGEISGSFRFSSDLEVDVSGNVYFLDDKGTSAFLTWSFETPYRCDLEITGTKGKIKARKIFTPKPDETVSVERTDMFGKIIETKEFKSDHFRELIIDFKRRVEECDDSHFPEILKQSNWQSYAKSTSFRTLIN